MDLVTGTRAISIRENITMIMQATKPVSESTIWTKELVQSHAQTAVMVEMYTLPFYLTALTSIKLPDKNDSSDQAKFTYETYDAILSVCIEEMLHLQLAANLCLALDIDAPKIFQKPTYGEPIPYLGFAEKLTKNLSGYPAAQRWSVLPCS